VLGELTSADLVQVDAAGRWVATAAGRSAGEQGEARRADFERRIFHFRDAPQFSFVPLDIGSGQPVAPPPGWSFDPAVLQRSAAQASEWKQQHGFPADVRAVLTIEDAEGPPPWQRIVVDQAEHLVLALTVVAEEGEAEELRGFL